jgi:hypothetical protein
MAGTTVCAPSGHNVNPFCAAIAAELANRTREAKTAFAKAMPRYGILSIFFISPSFFVTDVDNTDEASRLIYPQQVNPHSMSIFGRQRPLLSGSSAQSSR